MINDGGGPDVHGGGGFKMTIVIGLSKPSLAFEEGAPKVRLEGIKSQGCSL